MPSDPGMEELHGEMLSLLKEFHKLCVENDIKYSLHGGTLLGAIREKGFIPWDDDVDVTLRWPEFDKLAAVLDSCTLGEDIFLSTEGKTPCLAFKQEGKEPVWLDLFLYFPISKSRWARKCKVLGIMFLSATLHTPKTISGTSVPKSERLKYAAFYAAFAFGLLFPMPLKQRVFKWFCKNCFCGDGRYIHRGNDRYCGVKLVLPKEWMSEYILVPFEDTELMVTKNYHEVLVSTYGEDYMTPKRMEDQQSKAHEVMRHIVMDVSKQRSEATESEDR